MTERRSPSGRRTRVAEIHDVFPGSVGLLLPDRAVLAVAGHGLAVLAGRVGLVGAERVAEVAGSGDLRQERLPGQRQAGRGGEVGADSLAAFDGVRTGREDRGILGGVRREGLGNAL